MFERRERLLRITLTRALAVIANSPSSARRIAGLYQVDRGRIIELPFHWAMDDYPQYIQNDDLNYLMPIKAPNQAMEVWMAEFEAMWEYRGLWVTVWHPFNSGRLARCTHVAHLIEYMQKKGGVWFATSEEIAHHVQKSIDAGTHRPRVDRMPYYREPIPELRRT